MRKTAFLVVALIAVVVAAGCSTAPNDQSIVTDIKAKMFSDPHLKTASLSVTSQKGVVTLAGEVPSEAARYQAFKLAAAAPGVVRVEDKMSVAMAQVVEPPKPAAQPEPAPAPAPVRKKAAPRRQAPALVVEQAEAPAPAPAPPAQPAAEPAPLPVAAPAPEPPQPKQVVLEAGTPVNIRMIDGIDSEVNRAGETFRASLDQPITVDGEAAIPEGTDVYVKLVQAESAGRMTGRSELQLELVRMVFQGKTYNLQSSTYEQRGASRGKRTAATVAGGAAIGAAIGAIAGGGKGAAIGAAIGAGGGTAVQVMTKGQQVRVPSETRLEFRLEAPVEVTYFPEKNKTRSSR